MYGLSTLGGLPRIGRIMYHSGRKYKLHLVSGHWYVVHRRASSRLTVGDAPFEDVNEEIHTKCVIRQSILCLLYRHNLTVRECLLLRTRMPIKNVQQSVREPVMNACQLYPYAEPSQKTEILKFSPPPCKIRS